MHITLVKQRILTLALALALILSLAACGADGVDGGPDIRDTRIADYAFVPTYFELETGLSNVRSTVHNDRIYYYFAPWHLPDVDADGEAGEEPPVQIVIGSVAADGTDPRRMEILVSGASM